MCIHSNALFAGIKENLGYLKRVQPRLILFLLSLALAACPALRAQPADDDALHRHWFELRSQHFNFYSCAGAAETHQLAVQLEQFRDAYSLLAGAQAVASPPIIVLAFPDHDSLKPFLPVYDGQPASLSGFFQRGSDENLIVMSFNGTNGAVLDVIYHEYSHLLFRRNQNIWPLWLSEGMAEMYSTFEASGRGVQIGKPIARHLLMLHERSLIPLADLMNVEHDSPEYNERDRQGVFYAESWMLTHFLMNGDNAALKSRFGQYTKLLREGQSARQAFTNAMLISCAAVENEMKRYFDKGNFQPVNFVLPGSIAVQRPFTSRVLGQIEVAYWLGQELMRINRPEDAANYFKQCLKLAPNSPLGYDGLGLIAAEKGERGEALELLKKAIERNSNNFLTHTTYARQKLLMAEDSKRNFSNLDNALAEELRSELVRSLVLMPDFAMSHELLGMVLLARGQNLDEAEQHFQRVLELQPENQSCQVNLAQVRWRRNNVSGAREILSHLVATTKDSEIRQEAETLLNKIK